MNENAPALRRVASIPFSSLQQTDEGCLCASYCVCDLCALPDDVVLLVFGCTPSPCLLRAFSLHSQQQPSLREVCKLEDVRRAAYDTSTGTLLCALRCGVNDDDTTCLVSLHRDSSAFDWQQDGRVSISIPWKELGELAVCDSRVLLAEHGRRLHAFDVSAQHGLSAAGTVEPEIQFKSFSFARVSADNLVAFSHETDVSLHRLAGLRLEPLDCIKFQNPSKLLFRADLLLVADRNEADSADAILSLSATEGRLMRRTTLLNRLDVCINQWCLANDHLVVWDKNSYDILDYIFK